MYPTMQCAPNSISTRYVLMQFWLDLYLEMWLSITQCDFISYFNLFCFFEALIFFTFLFWHIWLECQYLVKKKNVFLLFETSLHNALETWVSCRLNTKRDLGGEHPLDQAVPVWFSNSIYSAVLVDLIHTIFPQHCVVRLFVPRKVFQMLLPQCHSIQLSTVVHRTTVDETQTEIDAWYETTINSLLESSSVAEKGTSPKG